jgi:hypothetical protein
MNPNEEVIKSEEDLVNLSVSSFTASFLNEDSNVDVISTETKEPSIQTEISQCSNQDISNQKPVQKDLFRIFASLLSDQLNIQDVNMLLDTQRQM